MVKNLFFVIVTIFSILFITKSSAQSFDYKENAAYIYNFIKYISLAQKKSDIEVGIIGNTPVEAELRILLIKKKGSGVNYNLKKIGIEQSSKCDIIIISKESTDQLKNINETTLQLPILIITEKANQGRNGACISFYINEDENYKTGYQLSLKNCLQRKLIINEQIKNNAELMR